MLPVHSCATVWTVVVKTRAQSFPALRAVFSPICFININMFAVQNFTVFHFYFFVTLISTWSILYDAKSVFNAFFHHFTPSSDKAPHTGGRGSCGDALGRYVKFAVPLLTDMDIIAWECGGCQSVPHCSAIARAIPGKVLLLLFAAPPFLLAPLYFGSWVFV